MIDAALRPLSNTSRVYAISVALALLAIAAAFDIGLASHDRVITRTVHEQATLDSTLTRAFGKPVQTVDGAQVNPNLAGLSCAVYAAGKTLRAVVCK